MYKEGSLVASVAVFSCLFVIIMIYYVRRNIDISKVEWDVSTVTASDYTVDMKISKDMYNTFAYNESENYRNQPIGYSLKTHLKKEMESVLTTKVPSQVYDNVSNIKIADI